MVHYLKTQGRGDRLVALSSFKPPLMALNTGSSKFVRTFIWKEFEWKIKNYRFNFYTKIVSAVEQIKIQTNDGVWNFKTIIINCATPSI